MSRTHFTLNIQNTEIASGSIERIEKNKNETMFHLIVENGDDKMIKKQQSTLCNLSLIGNQKLISLIF